MANSKKNKKVKNELVFDPKKREEFLTGFSKRKLQRKKKAADDNEQKLKEEKKRIREDTKNLKDKFKQSFKPITELDAILNSGDEESENENNFETDEVTVTISSIKPEELAKKNFIGYRKVQESESEDEPEEDKTEMEVNEIPGMETTAAKAKEKVEKDKDFEKLKANCKSEKDVKKLIKQQAKTAMKKSKIIQLKNHLNHKRNVKLSQRKKFKKEKQLRKHKKIPKKKSK